MGTHLIAQQELSNEYQHDRVQMVFKRGCIPVLWTKVALTLEGFLKLHQLPTNTDFDFSKKNTKNLPIADAIHR